jgi:hypothetical protein
MTTTMQMVIETMYIVRKTVKKISTGRHKFLTAWHAQDEKFIIWACKKCESHQVEIQQSVG